MDEIDQYFEKINEILDKIRRNEKEKILKAAEVMANTIANDKLIHVIGPGGHSDIGAREMFFRAGGLIPIDAILDPGWSLEHGGKRSTAIERTPGYILAVLKQYPLEKGDVLIITQPWGINSICIDCALEAKRLGLTVIAITSPEFSKKVPLDHPARHPSKKNLYEIADIVINNYMPFEDAILDIEGCPQKVSPVSTIATAFVINCLVAATARKLCEKKIPPPIWRSANIPGGDEYNREWFEKFKKIIRNL